MAKKLKSDPDQLAFAGLVLDAQEKFDFALPGGKKRKPAVQDGGNLPPNLAQPVQVTVPDFSNPQRPKTCLEVDFPIVPINALSQLEGNAGKPIYQMSKWWARRRSCVFRAMLIAAAMQAPVRKNSDGTPVVGADGLPEPDVEETAKAVWDVYYANHQAAGNFQNLRVLDCFMGGGTTLVEGSRLGFQVAGVDLNPVAWFIVKNELAGTDPTEVKRFFDQIEREVKPLIQPFYVTECPRGHKGKWFEVATGKEVQVNPLALAPEERCKYRYEGPEVIYTFWAKHGPCTKPGCKHRTPVFRSPVIAEKKLGVKFIELTCKKCKLEFHAELGAARMAPAAERVILPGEQAFSELSQPFAQRLLEYAQGSKGDKQLRAAELHEMVESEPGLKCPACGEFAGQFLRDVLAGHKAAKRAGEIDKKHLRIKPDRNSTKPVYCYLLIHTDWLKGSPGEVDGVELGGYADAPVDATVRWYEERLKNLKLIEVRGRIKLADDMSDAPVPEGPTEGGEEAEVEEEVTEAQESAEVEDRKQFGVPRFITLADGTKLDTRKTTYVRKATLACQACGQADVIIEALRKSQHSAPTAVYALQCLCPECKREGRVYDGRYFATPSSSDVNRISSAEREWNVSKDTNLDSYWPREEIPYGWQTHYWSIPDHGFTHWYRFFNCRQLLVHASFLQTICRVSTINESVRMEALGAFQQYLRNQCMFCIYDIGYDKLVPFFSNNNYVAKQLVLENSVFSTLGRGNWTSCVEKAIEGIEWASAPWEPVLAGC